MRFYKSGDQTLLQVPASEENVVNTYGSANGDEIGLPNGSAFFHRKGMAVFRNRWKSSNDLDR